MMLATEQARSGGLTGALLRGTVLGFCAMAVAGTASAQDLRLEEITVSARKVEESLQDVPITVNAFTAEQINELGVTDINELGAFTPGLTFEKFGGRRGAEGDTSRPVIRGQANILGESNAAIFIDGILFTESFLSFPFDIIERIEVVKGPQAALFGRSTFAGAINVITKKGSNEFENTIRLRAAQHDDYEVNVSSRGPIIEDELFYFVHFRNYEFGGEYDNSVNGERVGEESSRGFNGSLEWRATSDLTFNIFASYNEDDDGHPAQIVTPRFLNNCFLDSDRQYFCGAIPILDEVTVDTDRLGDEQGLEREVLRFAGSAEYVYEGFTFSVSGGITDSDSVFGNDQTFLGDPNNFAGGTFVRVEESDRTEWSIEGRVTSPQDDPLRYGLGLYRYEQSRDRIRRRPLSESIITDFGTFTIDNWAVFGFAEYDLLENLTGRFEIRYQEDEILNQTAAGTTLGGTFTSVLPRFTIDYGVTDNILLYGVVARGNKPGAINTNPVLPENLQTADEERSWNYEIGAKTNWWDNRILFNVAGYYVDWTQQQLTQSVIAPSDDGPIPISAIVNVGETEVIGFEVEAQAALTDFWSVGLGYAYSDAEIKEFCDESQALITPPDCTTAAGTEGGDVSGNQVPNSSKHQLSVSNTVTLPIYDQYSAFWRTNYSFESKKYAQTHNLAHTGARNLLDMKFGLQADSWTLTLFVDNITDNRTPSTIVRFADLVNINAGPGNNNVPGTTPIERGFLYPLADSRQFGVELDFRF